MDGSLAESAQFTGCYLGNSVLLGCCGFFGLFGRVLKVVLPNILPASVAGIFRGHHSVLWCSLLGSLQCSASRHKDNE